MTASPRTQRIAGRCLLLCLAVFATRTAWYDTRVIFESLLYSASMRKVFIVYALCLIPFVLIALPGAKYLLKSKLIAAYAILNFYGIILAAIYQNPGIYALQDVFKMTLVPVGFLLVWYDPPPSANQLLERLAKIIFGYQIVKFAIYLVWFRTSYGFVYGGVTDLFPVTFFAARAFSGTTRTGPRDITMALMSLTLIGLGQKRTLAVCVAVILLYYLVTYFGHVLRRAWPYLAGAGCLIGSLLFGHQLNNVVNSNQFRRILQTNVAASIGQESKRGREVRIVYEDLQDHGWLGLVFGIGHGAVYEEEVANVVTGEVVTHTVHFTPAAMHLRYGLLGFAVYGFTVLHLLFYRGSPVDGWISQTSLSALRAFGLCTFVCSLAIFGLIDDLMVGSIIGITMLSRHKSRRARAARKKALPVQQGRRRSSSSRLRQAG